MVSGCYYFTRQQSRFALVLLLIALFAGAPAFAARKSSAPRTSCGLQGTEAERLADCRKAFGEKAKRCTADFDFNSYEVPCADLDAFYAEGFSVRSEQFMTVEGGIAVVTLPSVRTRPDADALALELTHLQVVQGVCGRSGTPDERAADCVEQALREPSGTKSRICFLQRMPETLEPRLVACERAALFKQNGLPIRGWELIHSDGAGRQLWRDLDTRVISSAVENEVRGIFGALSHCQKPSNGSAVKGGLESVLRFDLPQCGALQRDLRQGLRYLIHPEAVSGRKLGCRGSNDDRYVDLADMNAVLNDNPFRRYSVLCQVQ